MSLLLYNIYHRTAGCDREGPLKVTLATPSAQAGTSRTGWPGQYPGSF